MGVPGIGPEYDLLSSYRSSVTFFLSHLPWSLIFSSILYIDVFSPIEILLSNTWLNWPPSELKWIQIIPNRTFIFILACSTFVFSLFLFFLVCFILFYYEVQCTYRKVSNCVLYSLKSNNRWNPISSIKPPPKSINRTPTAPRNPSEALLMLSTPLCTLLTIRMIISLL